MAKKKASLRARARHVLHTFGASPTGGYFDKIRGTIETLFALGLGGPQLKASGAVIEHRDATDAAYVIARGLDPVGANDFTTKNYVDSGTLGGVVREVRFAITNAASQPSATSIPANAVVVDAEIVVSTPYSGGATIAVGQTGSTSLLMGTSDNNPQSAGMYRVHQDQAWGGTTRQVLVTVGGAPAAGAGVCIVRYTTPAT